jgi:hypothetical protein
VKRLVGIIGFSVVLCGALSECGSGAEPAAPAQPAVARPTARAYGEWRIRVRPDKMKEYAQLIETKGLPLFRAAGGRMVGWWTTLVGDLYEQITIWEYDDMTAFEQAVEKLGKDKSFAEFVAQRDPLLSGEQSRFLQLADFAVDPALPEAAKVVVHEVHRVPLGRRDAYLKFMQTEGLNLLKRHGVQPVGPWIVSVGNWSEVSYLFRFDSLRERERLLAAFSGHADARLYGGKVNEFVDDVTTRILMPAAFSQRPAPSKP